MIAARREEVDELRGEEHDELSGGSWAVCASNKNYFYGIQTVRRIRDQGFGDNFWRLGDWGMDVGRD